MNFYTCDLLFDAYYLRAIIPLDEANSTLLFYSNLRSHLWVEKVKDLQCNKEQSFVESALYQ